MRTAARSHGLHVVPCRSNERTLASRCNVDTHARERVERAHPASSHPRASAQIERSAAHSPTRMASKIAKLVPLLDRVLIEKARRSLLLASASSALTFSPGCRQDQDGWRHSAARVRLLEGAPPRRSPDPALPPRHPLTPPSLHRLTRAVWLLWAPAGETRTEPCCRWVRLRAALPPPSLAAPRATLTRGLLQAWPPATACCCRSTGDRR